MKKLFENLAPVIISMLFQNVSFAVTTLSGLTEEATLPTRSPVVTFGYLIQVFISLLIVVGLIYFTAKYILPKFQVGGKGKLIEVVDRIGLEPQVSAYILRVGGRSWLVVASNKNVELISELEGRNKT